LLAQYAVHAPPATLDADGWWNGDAWRSLPAHRNERDASLRWPLDVQVAGPLAPLRARLARNGWREQAEADWVAVLGLLDDDRPPGRQPVLPATLDTEAETLLLRRPGDRQGEIKLLRLWRAPVQLVDGGPLWVGTTQVLHYAEPFGLFGLWLPDPDTGVTHDEVRAAMAGFAMEQSPHPHTGVEVLRLRVPADADAQDIMPSN
jgi:hypothetical protein